MTAGWSKGSRQYYLYYRCIEHTNVNIPGAKLHEQFDQLLKELRFDDNQINFLIEGAKALLDKPLQQKHEITQQKLKELKSVKDKIMSLEEKFLSNDINSSTYQTWSAKLKEEKTILEAELKPRLKKVTEDGGIVERVLPNLSNLFGIYEKCNVTQKHAIIRGVFKDNLAYGGGQFRTNYINPAFESNLLNINKKKDCFFMSNPF